MNIDLDIWDSVRRHTWKWSGDRDGVTGIVWHATRSGITGRTAEQERLSTVNWFLSPNNRVENNGNPFAGMSNYIIGGGKLVRAVPEDLVPRFSAGIHDYWCISVEMGQATIDSPFDPRDIELARELAADLSARHKFKLGRITFLDSLNTQLPGEVGHEDTAQGRGQGKSDPGPLFWPAYLAKQSEDEPMNAADFAHIERLQKQIYQLQTQVWGENPVGKDGLRTAYVDIDFSRMAGENSALKARTAALEAKVAKLEGAQSAQLRGRFHIEGDVVLESMIG